MIKVLLFFLISAFLPQKIFADEHLVVGDSFEVPATRGTLTIEDGRILRAHKRGKDYEIQAIAPGVSTYRLGDEVETVIVQSASFAQTSHTLSRLVRQSLSFQFVPHGGEIFVTGRLVRFRDWQSLANGCARIVCRYRADFQIPPEIFPQIRRRIAEEFSIHDLGTVDLVEHHPLELQASVDSAELRSLADRFGLRVQIEKSALSLLPSIKVQLVIAEVKKSEGQKLGIDWPSQYDAQVLPNVLPNGNPLLVSAQFLESRGIGRVLASPNLLCRSGKEAEFLAGGEIPIKIMNIRMQDVVWKKYGILLKIHPEADFHGHMSIGLTAEISSIDPAHTVDGIPGFFSNRVQSHFDLREPRTIALSGLIKSEESTATNGLPFLSRIPLLGKLFGSEDFRQNRTELVIFVRPEVVSSRGDGG